MDIHRILTAVMTASTLRGHALRVHRSAPWVLCLTTTAAVMAAGCGASEPVITPATIDGDRILFERGTAALMEERWIEARDNFLQVRDNYPQSSLRAEARLGIADAYEGEGGAVSFVSALAEYEDFLSLYPTHPRAAYAQFKLAMVHYQQMRPPERDQSWTRSAVQEFERFLERYPNSEYVGDARVHLREARNRLSESELVVGRYYHRNKWWPGAIDRLTPVFESDPEFSERELVCFYLGDALYKSGQIAEALPIFRILLEEFPGTEFAEEATAAMADIETRLVAGRAAALAADGADGNNTEAEPGQVSR